MVVVAGEYELAKVRRGSCRASPFTQSKQRDEDEDEDEESGFFTLSMLFQVTLVVRGLNPITALVALVAFTPVVWLHPLVILFPKRFIVTLLT